MNRPLQVNATSGTDIPSTFEKLGITKPYKKSPHKAYFTPYKAIFEELYLYQ